MDTFTFISTILNYLKIYQTYIKKWLKNSYILKKYGTKIFIWMR